MGLATGPFIEGMDSPLGPILLRVSFLSALYFIFTHLPLKCAHGHMTMFSHTLAPVRTEKHVEKRVVDGVEQEHEVEVELPLKRLSLFPGKEVR